MKNISVDTTKLKIYFYSPGVVMKGCDTTQSVFMNTTPLYLDLYCKQQCPELFNYYEWSKIQYLFLNQNQIIEEIDRLEIDILAIGIYTWNKQNVLQILQQIKKKTKKPIKILLGGPSVDVIRNPNFFTTFSEIDFAIYAQGEVPFVSIIKHFIGKEQIKIINTKNVAWVEEGKIKKADYEFTRIKTGSYITENLDLLKQIVYDDTYTNYELQFPYETSRGCPYNCSFCDWTSGLSHKVQKRQFVYQEEIEILGALGLQNIYLADANFGLWSNDLEIAKEFARLKKTKYNFHIHGFNFSKTKKDRVYEIAEIFLESNLIPFLKVSIQDMDETVLKNIDRPDITYEEHMTYVNDIREKYPNSLIVFEIIKGLPGQTRKSWDKMFNVIARDKVQLRIYDWELIPNSPAGYDPEYRKKMKIKTTFTVDPTRDNCVSEDVVETLSYDILDYAYFTLTANIYDFYFRKFVSDYPKIIELMKKNKFFDSTLDLIKTNIKNKSDVKKIAKNFLIQVLSENGKYINKNFIKFVVKNKNIDQAMTLSYDSINASKNDSLHTEVFIKDYDYIN